MIEFGQAQNACKQQSHNSQILGFHGHFWDPTEILGFWDSTDILGFLGMTIIIVINTSSSLHDSQHFIITSSLIHQNFKLVFRRRFGSSKQGVSNNVGSGRPENVLPRAMDRSRSRSRTAVAGARRTAVQAGNRADDIARVRL